MGGKKGTTSRQPTKAVPNKVVKPSNERKAKTDKITAYISTYKDREEHLPNTIKSIIGQVDEVVIWANDRMKVPKGKKITTFFADDILGYDIGAAGKLVFAYEWKGYVFCLDDDIVYPKDYVKKSIEKIEEYKREVVISWHGSLNKSELKVYQGRGMLKNCSFRKNTEKDEHCNLIGTGVLCFHADTIQPAFDIMEVKHTNMIDIYFSMAMDSRAIECIVPAHEKGWLEAVDTGGGISFNKNKEHDNFKVAVYNTHNWINYDRH